MVTDNTITILIGGEAGQGIATIGEILTKALVRSGYSLVVTQSYQSRIRGGHNSFAIRFGNQKITASSEAVNLLVALNQETVEIHRNKLADGGVVLADSGFHIGKELNSILVPYKELAEGKQVNTIALGVVSSLIGLDEKLVVNTLISQFEKWNEEEIAKNSDIIRRAYKWASNEEANILVPGPEKNFRKNIVLNGNQAIALGAISSGLKFYSFYPMTPATSIALGIIKHADEMKIVVEQAEDEISAINMVIGASYAGAVSMTGTSGGGFALMVEGVSLAAMTETPIVIAVGQRPGPATGLPTRTEQADLDFVLNSGHGEFSRAIFAPGSVEECFFLTRKSFELAEKYQSPVFILTDQFLADSYRDVKPFDVSELGPVRVGLSTENITGQYTRFAFADDGISPRALPGLSKNLVIVDSDEHTEDGHITEDLEVRTKMVEKRLAKLRGLSGEVVPPRYEGGKNPDILLIAWGSSQGVILEVLRILDQKGVKAGALLFSQIWPIKPDQFIDTLKSAKRIIAIEGNAFGQFARLLQRESGTTADDRILRYDGLPITTEYVLERLKI